MWLLLLSLLFSVFTNAISAELAQQIQHRLKSVDNLKDKRVFVLLGSGHESYATEYYPDAQILQYKSPSDVLLAVKIQKVEYVNQTTITTILFMMFVFFILIDNRLSFIWLMMII